MPSNKDIANIQRQYLEIVENHFRNVWDLFCQSGLSAHKFLYEKANLIFSNKVFVPHGGKQWQSLAYEADQLLNDVSRFWEINQQALQVSLKASDRLNTQVGDLNAVSSYYYEASSRLGLYFDSICLIDPLAIIAQRRHINEIRLSGRNDDPEIIRILLGYLDVRALSPLLLSETDLPIAILVPPVGIAWGDHAFDGMDQLAQDYTFRIFAEAFNKRVDSFHDLVKIFEGNSLRQIEKIFKGHAALSKLLNQFGSLESLVNYSEATESVSATREYARLPKRMKHLTHIKGMIQGIFLAMEGAEASAANLGIDLNIPKDIWEFSIFKSRCNTELLTRSGLRAEIPVQAAIMSKKMDWLSATTVQDLVKLREKGFLEKVREIYRVGRRDLQQSSMEDIDKLASQVINNVTEGLEEYVGEIEKFNRDSNYGWLKKITLFAISGSLAIGSLYIPALGAISAAYTLALPGVSLLDMILQAKREDKEWGKLMTTPIAHMLEIWKRRTDID